MNKLVSESLSEYIQGDEVNESTVNEAVDPMAIQMLAGTITALLASGGLAVLHDKMKKSDNKIAKKIALAMEKAGKSAGSGIKGGVTSESFAADLRRSQKVNEALDPAMMELATIAAGTIGTTIAAGGLAVLIDKLQKSENPTAKKFAKFLGGLAKGAKSGVTQEA